MNHFTTDRQPMTQQTSWPPAQRLVRWGPVVLMAVILPVLPWAVKSGESWQWMVGMAVVVYVICKWLTWRDEVFDTTWRAWGYLYLWPGMDATPFADSEQQATPLPRKFLAWGVLKMLAGLGLVVLTAPAMADQPLLAGWLAMVGLVMLLHFGVFDVLAWAWRRAGLDVLPIMLQPGRSQSLGEFWGRRWNRSFNQLVYRWVYQPMYRQAGARVALLMVFAASGLIHELVITVPARGGYGLPTVYFLLQGLALLLQKTRLAKRLHLDRGWPGWVITLGVVIAPLGLLFPPVFVLNVILPFLRVMGLNA